jgi:hypothetical protein
LTFGAADTIDDGLHRFSDVTADLTKKRRAALPIMFPASESFRAPPQMRNPDETCHLLRRKPATATEDR